MSSPIADIDWFQADPQRIKDEIARTRTHMDEHLSQLGRKLSPGPKLKRLALPIAALALAGAGFLILRAVRRRSAGKHMGGRGQLTTKISRLQLKSAGIWDQFRAVRLALSIARTGKPAIFIVEPPRS